ncbi:putative mitochondrial Mitochondrial ornithine carrier protein-like protein [Leptomonas pyrrhocoris]|uniref:Putative mitochondrial Mitochondrial ornithine carrier protein-like protein n=1 Tax=Leptomonas pyrrhocoris TaxID=157538 RepID=A0A0M9FRS6_LEPPY|nr:putative mitochondrial Mitochondrial ornithine carrier protein-like protein [Leptomonas pyrrhocoris]KPA74546.1 putative mitochondrial Mitochondrial ornithine carrier protein-like protein [Leptomonas pyrrhocoris]|eukprot:XP_015652985.1 putative mitochondrial Mitochondrial ornithine carrier protein-like protein [Leptomonas pyrrhocoris]
MVELVMDLAAGGISGVVCALVGYPFETVLVLMQSHKLPAHTTYRSCVTDLYRREGVGGFFKGIPPRLFASAVEYSLTFGGYKSALRLVGASEERLTLLDVCAGGIGGGLATTTVLTPLELLKCRMQVTPQCSHSVSGGGGEGLGRPPLTLSAWVRHVYHREGGLRGFYQGGAATLLREVPGTALWCGANDVLRETMTPRGCSAADLPLWDTILCGGLSGLVYAVFVYPVDVMKTRIQTEPKRYRMKGFAQAVRTQYRTGGACSFYRGFGLVALFSFPSSALLFVTYEYAMHGLVACGNRV